MGQSFNHQTGETVLSLRLPVRFCLVPKLSHGGTLLGRIVAKKPTLNSGLPNSDSFGDLPKALSLASQLHDLREFFILAIRGWPSTFVAPGQVLAQFPGFAR